MSNYYDDIVKEIQAAADAGSYAEALALIKRELDMPYVPRDTETALKRIRQDIRYAQSDAQPVHEKTTGDLLDDLKKDDRTQLSAAGVLAGRSLRECIAPVQEYLQNNPCPEAAALLVDALAQQGVNDEFVWNKSGVEYTFWPDCVTPVAASAGFQEALQDLEDWLAQDNPTVYAMCRQMLIHEAYLFLPLSYDQGEGQPFAYQTVKQVADLMGDSSILAHVDQKLKKPGKRN
jgi:hypothetical protein